ncbi:MAG: hypothetical protein OSB69_23630 [Alphaproteobacteria bacterium]|nr:hypothetical protein [Alphaproteobacteria bacterium]
MLDFEGIVTDHQLPADTLDHPGDHMRIELDALGCTDPRGVVIGDQFDKDEILAAGTGRRIADDEGFEIGDLHISTLSQALKSRGGRETGRASPCRIFWRARSNFPSMMSNFGQPMGFLSAMVWVLETVIEALI